MTEGASGTVAITGSVSDVEGIYIGQVGTGLAVMTVGSLGVVNNYFGNSFVGKTTAGMLTVQAGGTVTGDGANVLNIQHDGTVMVNGGTLGGYGDIAVGGIQDAPNIGTLAVAAGTLEGTLVTVGDGGLFEATTATIGTAITQGDIGTLAIDAGGTVVLSSVTLNTDALLSLDLLLLDGGSLGPAVMIVSGAATIDGAATIEGTGTLEIGGSITGPGTLDLKGALTLQLDLGTSGGPAVMFQAGAAQTLILGTPLIDSTAFAGMTAGLNALIDLGNGFAINAISDTPGTVGQNIILDVTEGATSGTIVIDNVQFITGANEFFITTNPTTGDAAIETIACFAAGTRIATPRGEVAVEALCVGDLVQTLLGEDQAPIIWIGHRHTDCTRHPQPRKVWPVRIAAGAFGPGQPHTDLFLSPDHAVYVNEVLIPAKHLIKGSSIAQVPMDRVTYYHLELPQHAVVLAQGLAAESFLDLKDGPSYANRAGPVRLYPDLTAGLWEAFGCAPLIVTGPELAAARAVIECFTTTRSAASYNRRPRKPPKHAPPQCTSAATISCCAISAIATSRSAISAIGAPLAAWMAKP